jgi:hypothetical protein
MKVNLKKVTLDSILWIRSYGPDKGQNMKWVIIEIQKHKFRNDGYIDINLRQNSMKNLSHSK